MTYNIFIRNNRSDGYTATALAFPGYSVDAPTRDEALARMYETLQQLLNDGEVVAMEVPTPTPSVAEPYEVQLQALQRQLAYVTGAWTDERVRQQFVAEFPKGAQALWDICPEVQQDICVTLVMATRRLTRQALSLAQLAALHQLLTLLQDTAPNEAMITACHQQLIACGLPPMMGGSQQLVDLYEDEL